METKQNLSGSKKEGKVTRIERTSATHQAELILKGIKEKAGEVVLVAISNRTTIELPASLSQVERDARVANYIKLHQSKNKSSTL
ncbi:MAG: hypothetical protein LUG98_07745 [Tannerellaceae bacterium]|nr:hypothetical protein [Tannerellaceae bacterium]